MGMSNRTAIYTSFPQAVPKQPVIDRANCIRFKTGKCGVCQKVCPAGAINYEFQDMIVELKVGAVIIATGFSLFDAGQLPRYGYGRLKNVYSSLEFERLCHASGPTGGRIVTKEGKTPQSVAILHCIGSRDENHLKYCSRVCCMYSLKFAHLVKEKTGAEVYNLYIDIRAPGKGYEEFYKRLLNEGVHFIRGKAAEVTDAAESPEEEGKLVVVCEDTLLGLTRRLPVDLVILSAGLRPATGSEKVAQAFALSCAQGDFFLEKHPKLAPVDTASDGIYLAGACQGPKDIPDSVAQGGAAAAAALSLMDCGKFVLEPVTAEIDEQRCAGCKLCIANCPYTAITFDAQKKVSVVAKELCKGCGTCVAGCPSGAAKQENFEDAQVFAEIEGLLMKG
jgi:heterodisulfide reductase subunit A